MSRERVGTLAEFPVGEGRSVDVRGIDVAVLNVDGDLFGIVNHCPHKRLPLLPKNTSTYVDDRKGLIGCSGGDVATNADADSGTDFAIGGIDEEELTINCFWHNLSFDLQTGYNEVLDSEISTFDVVVEDEEVFVEL